MVVGGGGAELQQVNLEELVDQVEEPYGGNSGSAGTLTPSGGGPVVVEMEQLTLVVAGGGWSGGSSG